VFQSSVEPGSPLLLPLVAVGTASEVQQQAAQNAPPEQSAEADPDAERGSRNISPKWA